MSVIQTLRPVSDRTAGTATTVPGGTLAAVASDNSDATYINSPESNGYWLLRMESHTPAAGYGRHLIRGRSRMRTDAGTATEEILLGRGSSSGSWSESFPVAMTDTITEQTTSWVNPSSFNLGATTINDFNVGGGRMSSEVGAAFGRTMEVYLDLDMRQQPQFTAQVLDDAGVNRAGGVVTDTPSPEFFIASPAYDDLPPLDWSISVTGPDGTVLDVSGGGTPPGASIPTDPLPDGNYTATFTVRSTIRGTDPFSTVQVVTFAINNIVPPPSPPLITAEREGEGYRITWENPGGQPWDDDYTVAEIWRDDCGGSARIATVPNGLNGSYLDLAIPQSDSEHVLMDGVCTVHVDECAITYRIRYWGYVSTTIELPDTVPVQLVLAWPGTAGTIPNGWLRVTDLDGYYPRGATTALAPSATGGVASHSHTSPSHRHALPAHLHVNDPASTASSGVSTTTDRFNGAGYSTVNQSHSHTLPRTTGEAPVSYSGYTAPGTTTTNNQPPTREVIWIRSDGSATVYPIGVLGWSAQAVSGWVTDTASASRFLRGAAAAGNGGASYGSATHTHTVNSHTHTGAYHDHPNFTTGLSGPAATSEGNGGSGTPRWLPRHTHPGNVVANDDAVPNAATGGVTGSAGSEPPHRRLRVLRNTMGGIQTRIIGLFTGAIADLDPSLTYCNGAGGTPDMRTWFARDAGTASINSTAGSSTHTHSTPAHGHGFDDHVHNVIIGESNTTDRGRDTSGDLGQVPTATHIHTAENTERSFNNWSAAGAGTTGSSSTLPVYREAHFVRLDGIVSGVPLDIPELRITDFASVTVPALIHGDGLDRLGNLVTVLAVPTDRGHSFPRLVVDSIPIDGGMHTVSTQLAGEDLTLAIAVQGKSEIDALEEVLRSDRVYWAPVGGTPGWFAPGSWSVTAPTSGVKQLSVVLVRQPWPSTDDPEDFV